MAEEIKWFYFDHSARLHLDIDDSGIKRSESLFECSETKWYQVPGMNLWHFCIEGRKLRNEESHSVLRILSPLLLKVKFGARRVKAN